jgi:membrane protein required for colicin V production
MIIFFAGLVLGIFLAGRFYQAFGDKLTFISSSQAASIVAYVIILFAVLAASATLACIFTRIVSAMTLGWANHLAGAVLGLAIAAVFAGALLAIWAKNGGGGSIINSSLLGKFLLGNFPLVLALLPGDFSSIKSFLK